MQQNTSNFGELQVLHYCKRTNAAQLGEQTTFVWFESSMFDQILLWVGILNWSENVGRERSEKQPWQRHLYQLEPENCLSL